MQELDVLLMRFVDAEMSAAEPGELATFQRLLSLQDPEIHALLMGRSRAQDPALAMLVRRILETAEGGSGPGP